MSLCSGEPIGPLVRLAMRSERHDHLTLQNEFFVGTLRKIANFAALRRVLSFPVLFLPLKSIMPVPLDSHRFRDFQKRPASVRQIRPLAINEPQFPL